MRIRLQLSIKRGSNALPINYQYPVAAWIYKTIHLANPEFSHWLHEQGYSYEKRKFKLFTFSPIKFENYIIQKDRIIAQTPNCSITLSFLLPEAVKHFVSGCFKNQHFGLGDKISQVDFEVKAIDIESPVEFDTVARFRSQSPICISEPVERNGKLTSQYRSPNEVGYEKRFFDNLTEKYQSANEGLAVPTGSCKLTVLSAPKSKLITIKQGTSAESKVRGYQYDFEVQAPKELIGVGYYTGFGSMNSMGFGITKI
jgi:CRISPR-associated endoribonuclease Cas6